MKTKQDAIREAYEAIGYQHLLQFADSNGWIRVKAGQYQNEVFNRLKMSERNHAIQPKSLNGIDKNNGWVRVWNELDLPTEKTACFFLVELLERTYTGYYNPENKSFVSCGFTYIHDAVTHYQPITKPNTPLY